MSLLLFDRYALKAWYRVIKKVAHNNSTIDNGFIDEIIIHSGGVKRILYKQFHSLEKVTIKDIVFTLAMEALECWELKNNEMRIVQFSQALFTNWYEEILDNSILKGKLEGKTGKTIHSMIEEYKNDLLDLENILWILKSPNNLRKEYFKTYSTNKEYDLKIRIYYPNEQNILDKSNTIDISIGPFDVFERGFFKEGYDYWLLDEVSEKKAHLIFATISKDRKKEVAIFSEEYCFGIHDINHEKAIWLS